MKEVVSEYSFYMLTPVAEPILRGGNLSPILQGRFCKLYPADFSVAIYLFVCS